MQNLWIAATKTDKQEHIYLIVILCVFAEKTWKPKAQRTQVSGWITLSFILQIYDVATYF